MPKIDEAEYRRGLDDFDRGQSLRSVMEPIFASNNINGDDDEKNMSRVLGFFGGLLDRLRGLAR